VVKGISRSFILLVLLIIWANISDLSFDLVKLNASFEKSVSGILETEASLVTSFSSKDSISF
jgi:hypothetical protein